jgi:hypothetical protein
LETQIDDMRPEIPGALVLSQGRFPGFLYTFTNVQGVVALINPKTVSYRKGEAISPDRKWLFYWYEGIDSEPNFGLYSLDGQLTRVTLSDAASHNIFWYGDTFYMMWQNNNEIQVGMINNIDQLFNLFTMKYRDVPKFPAMDMLGVCNDELLCAVDYAGFQPYDSAFELWVYANAGGYYLIDREGNILWGYSGPLAGFNLPKWQPGDQKLGIPMPKNEQDVLGEHYEIFTVDRAGRQRQLTNYSLAYPTMTIDKFSWSPDGRYIAFWGDTHSKEKIAQQNPYRLFVLDTVTHQTIDYCVPGGYVSQYNPSGIYSDNPAPIWSPNGSQIAVESLQSGKRMIMLVDFASGTVSPVAEGDLVGWMAMP